MSHVRSLDDGWDELSRDHLARISDFVDSMDIRSPRRPIFSPSDFLGGYSLVLASALIKRFLKLLDLRRAESDIDELQVDALSEMIKELDGDGGRQYRLEIEPKIIDRASKYYTTMAVIWIQECDLIEYVSIVEHLLVQERNDCDRWLLQTTKQLLLDATYKSLVEKTRNELLQKLKGFSSVLREGTKADIRLVYRILHEMEGTIPAIVDSLKLYIQDCRTSLHSVDDIMSSWLRYQDLLKDCFHIPCHSLQTCVDTDSPDVDQATGDTRIPEVVGDKAVNPYISNAIRMAFKDIVSGHQDFIKEFVTYWDGVITSGDDIHNRLRQCCELLEFIDQRTYFYQCYKFKLAARLLYERSSLQVEQLSLSMIEPKIAADEVSSLRRMIKESHMSRDNNSYPQIHLYSKSTWPALRDYAENLKLHEEFQHGIEHFIQSQNNHLNRDIVINRMLGRVELEFDSHCGSKRLLCDLAQASALLLFTDDTICRATIAKRLGVSEEFAMSILQPLIDKAVLLSNGDTLTLNSAFEDLTDVTLDAVPTYRTATSVPSRGLEMDANAVIDANIMSILKSVKSMKRDDLLLQLSHHPQESILARIQNLCEREYITTSDDTITYLP
ncbi:hypothetical protein BaOVIS_007130 [Babesia ovis]|uniref:Cullin family profile domain-containing protein n=1 Tax=Babesia ovis TaxID=5869 RepID=A0A9W5WTZ3_BABOV|nr:hypothetical protein BaOVIS_007130 [Babesia ovis]